MNLLPHRMGVCRTAATQIKAICKEDAKNREDGSRNLSEEAIGRIRQIAQDSLTIQSKRHQHDTPEAQQDFIQDSRNKINYHLSKGPGTAGVAIVDQVAEGMRSQAALTQALYARQVQVTAPTDPLAAANAQIAGTTPGTPGVPPSPPPFNGGQEGPWFPASQPSSEQPSTLNDVE